MGWMTPRMSLPFAVTLAFLLILIIASPSYADEKAFSVGGPTVNLAVTGTTGRVQFQPQASSKDVRVFNSGTVAVFIECGGNAVVATLTTSVPVAPGSVEIFGCPQQYVAGISSGTATIYLTPGNGI